MPNAGFDDSTEDDVQGLLPAEEPRLVLLVSVAGVEDRLVPLVSGQPVIVGRAADCTVRVDAPSVSKRHAAFTLSGDTLTLRDLGSHNGTKLRGTPIAATITLAVGDEVQIGPATLAAVAIGKRSGDSATWEPSERLVVADPAMRQTFMLARRVAAMPTSVLVIGETGVGKEVVVATIHEASPRSRGPFVCVNCAALTESLVEAALFGHEKGAFTGADRAKAGLLETAAGGTLFLDEIGEMSLVSQAKLLRVLESRSFMRVGGTSPIPFDARVVAATNRDLEASARTGDMREDLYYRLAGFVLRIPPLRERKDEISIFARMFLRELAFRIQERPPQLSPEAIERLRQHSFPGNVRELRNAMEHAFVLATGGVVQPEHLPPSIRDGDKVAFPRSRLELTERKGVEDALVATAGNHTHAAERLGISRRTLLHKMAKYRLGKYANAT